MFSANENIQLRKHKRTVVSYVESTIPEDILDLGVNVMAMQVSCKAPGCVPLETAIVIVFPKSEIELLENLPQSAGGSYKTKILKPMAQVTKDDVLDALPPSFEGGKRSMEKLCLQARDVMLGQITQLFGDDDVSGRKLMAEYLQESLQQYMDGGCEPPEWGEAFAASKRDDADIPRTDTVKEAASPTTPAKEAETKASAFSSQGNIVIQRPANDDEKDAREVPSVNSITRLRQQQTAERHLLGSKASSLLSKLARQHAPGVRRPGCPCCDPDDPSHIVDNLMML